LSEFSKGHNSDGKRSYCKACAIKEYKEYYYNRGGKNKARINHILNREHDLEKCKEYFKIHGCSPSKYNPQKQPSRMKVFRAKRNGTINKPTTCELCHKETSELEAHHLDYGKPLDVIWLCSTCHSLQHHPEFKRLWEEIKCQV
jgi:hypothetical protein